MLDPQPSESERHILVYRFATYIALGLIFLCVGWSAVVYNNPRASINPFPPPNQPAATPSLMTLGSPTIYPTDSPTPSPTESITPSPTLTETSLPIPNPGSEPADLTATPKWPFALSPAGVRATVAFQGCAWQGIAGQIFDPLGDPIPYLIVSVGGQLDGRPLALEAVTARSALYGDGAFEIKLGDSPIPSENTIWIQLLDSAKHPLSERISMRTFEGCDKNLLLVDFQQAPP